MQPMTTKFQLYLRKPDAHDEYWFPLPIAEVKSRCIPGNITFGNFVKFLGMRLYSSKISNKTVATFIPKTVYKSKWLEYYISGKGLCQKITKSSNI